MQGSASRAIRLSDYSRNSIALPSIATCAAFAFIFLGFFPNPAIPLTGQIGLQANQLLAFALVPWIILRRTSIPHLLAVISLLSAAVVTGFVAVISDTTTHADLVIKMLVLLLISAIVIIPAGYYAEPRNLRVLTLSVSLALLVHVVVGQYQIESFKNSSLPFASLYNNPSFSSVSSVAETYATYVKRPFGLFPEPSALGACMGPWLIFLLGVFLQGSQVTTRSRTLRWLVLAAFVGGTYMMFQARSGYTPLWLASLIPVAMYYPIAKSKPGYSRIAKVAVGAVISVVLVVFTQSYVSSSLNSESVESNDSWAARQQSIVIGITAPSQDPKHFVFGFGPGQSATYLQTHSAGDLVPSWYSTEEIYDIQAVWSVFGTLYMENGFIGLIVIVGMCYVVVRSVWRSNARILGYSIFLSWLFGITIATSYFPLSPLWICLAVLLVWDRLFAKGQEPFSDEPAWVAPNPRTVPDRSSKHIAWAPGLFQGRP
jgi:hypothetical protein